MKIRPIDLEHLTIAADLIRQSFRTVAEEFGLSPDNCPTHPSFLTEERLCAHVADGLQLFGCSAGEALVGVIGIKQRTPRDFEIERLAVLPEYRHRGIGAKLMIFAWEQIVRQGGEKACIGIIDENVVLKAWYQRWGFIVTEIKRFPHLPFTVCQMEKVLNRSIVDDTDWAPFTVNALAHLFSEMGIPWWISGGWALDLYLGKQTRPHADTDILILRNDQLLVQEHLRDWQLFKTHQPGLAPWPMGEYLHPPVNSIWVRREEGAPWAFEIMLMETEGDEWVFRRLPAIRGPIRELGLQTDAGISYLAPEIQLLYKGRQEYRQKDLQDLQAIMPKLPAKKKQWLLECLRRQFPGGHDWIDYLVG
ncbi:MAG TPA: GNAT family N-acetyltransferase [Armatimonadota bacterium]|jgi:GNAT superfamily N-acetyltransferase